MSCRIDRVVSDANRVVLLVSGRIRGEDVDMLRGVLEQESGGFAIDLKNVVLVDREAVKLLALSEALGTELRNCPPYIREWVTRERAETHGRPSEQGLAGPPSGQDGTGCDSRKAGAAFVDGVKSGGYTAAGQR